MYKLDKGFRGMGFLSFLLCFIQVISLVSIWKKKAWLKFLGVYGNLILKKWFGSEIFFFCSPLPLQTVFRSVSQDFIKKLRKNHGDSLGALGNCTMLAGRPVFGLGNRVFHIQGGAFAIIKMHPRGLESTQHFLGALNNFGCEYMMSKLLRSHLGVTDGPQCPLLTQC